MPGQPAGASFDLAVEVLSITGNPTGQIRHVRTALAELLSPAAPADKPDARDRSSACRSARRAWLA
jgi:hypothetical protein